MTPKPAPLSMQGGAFASSLHAGLCRLPKCRLSMATAGLGLKRLGCSFLLIGIFKMWRTDQYITDAGHTYLSNSLRSLAIAHLAKCPTFQTMVCCQVLPSFSFWKSPNPLGKNYLLGGFQLDTSKERTSGQVLSSRALGRHSCNVSCRLFQILR